MGEVTLNAGIRRSYCRRSIRGADILAAKIDIPVQRTIVPRQFTAVVVSGFDCTGSLNFISIRVPGGDIASTWSKIPVLLMLIVVPSRQILSPTARYLTAVLMGKRVDRGVILLGSSLTLCSTPHSGGSSPPHAEGARNLKTCF